MSPLNGRVGRISASEGGDEQSLEVLFGCKDARQETVRAFVSYQDSAVSPA